MIIVKRIFCFLIMVATSSSVFAQEKQEEKLIHSLLALYANEEFNDSIKYQESLSVFISNFEISLQQNNLENFTHFLKVADSLYANIIIKKPVNSNYEIVVFQKNFINWSFLMENKKIILKEKAFYYFDTLYNLDSQHYLLIKKTVEMSNTCFDGYIYKKNSKRATNKKVVSVCSWTNIDVSIAGEENPELKLVHFEPIEIKYDEKTKVLSYLFIRQSDGKYVNRSAKYKNGSFKIKNYDARTFEE